MGNPGKFRSTFIVHMLVYMSVFLTVLLTINARYYTMCVIWALFTYIIGREIIDEIRLQPSDRVARFQKLLTPRLMLALVLVFSVAWLTFPRGYIIHLAGAGLLIIMVFSLFIHNQTVRIMATQEEHAAELRALKVQNDKARQEVLAKIAKLEEALANQGNTTPEVDAALADLKASIQTDDDIVEDAPPPPPPDEENQG